MTATAEPSAAAENLTREEWLIATAIVAAACSANAADSGDPKAGGEKQMSQESKKRIAAYVVKETSLWQRESLVSMCPTT